MKKHPVNALVFTVLAAGLLPGAACSRSANPANEPAPPIPTETEVYDFERAQTGQTLSGFTADLTGGGGPGRWQVVQAPAAPSGKRVVAQLSADQTSAR